MAKFKCLVVDDSPTMRQLVVFALKRVPELDIVEASDGVDALKKLPGQKFDLVLCDINMPIMDGLKLLSLMKNNPVYKEIPVVMITTEGAAEDRDKGLALGAQAYLPKPIQTNNLLKVVREILRCCVAAAARIMRVPARPSACPARPAELFVRWPGLMSVTNGVQGTGAGDGERQLVDCRAKRRPPGLRGPGAQVPGPDLSAHAAAGQRLGRG